MTDEIVICKLVAVNSTGLEVRDGYRRRWNLTRDGSLWIVAPESVSEVGCIHTCQGLELDYVGVIIGPDMVMEQSVISTRAEARARHDQSLKGLGKLDEQTAKQRADAIIKNTYRTLMTRGMKGCYVYCTDAALAAYIKGRLISRLQEPQASAEVLPFRKIDAREAARSGRAVRLVDLKLAAGFFEETYDAEGDAWAELPEHFHVSDDMFVAQVVGESMNRTIPNGAWCLFRERPSGTRQGKVVVARHRAIDDPDCGGHYTVKRYFSEKRPTADDSWSHVRIELRPDSDRPEYRSILIASAQEDEFVIVAELLAVLS